MSEATIVPTRFYTVDEFWEFCHLPENAGKRFELVNGEIREMVPTGGEHGEVGGDLFGPMWSFNHAHKLGRLTTAETGFVLGIRPDGKADVRAPDIGFVSIERAPQPFGSKYVPMAPDLAVEVVSPGDKDWEIDEKIDDYLRYGVRLIWVVRPASKTVTVYRGNNMKRLTVDDTLDGEDVLPGFAIKVSEIFPK
jgi:Uma2 family endonuclease